MKQIEIEWVQLGLKVTATLVEDKNPNLCKLLWDNLPYASLQTHALVSGEHLYHVAPIPELVTTRALYKEDRTQSPDGTVFLSQLQHLAVKYGHLTEYIHAAPIGYVLPEDLDTLKRAGAACWRSVTDTKEPIEVRVSRKGETAPMRFPAAERIEDPGARQLLEDVLGAARDIWTTPPREILDIHEGRIRSRAGSLGQWHTTLVFVNGETRPLGYGAIGGLIQLSRSPEISLEVLKIITGSFIKVPAEFLGYCGLDTLWSFVQRTIEQVPALRTKDEYYALLSALALYVNQLNAWNLHYFPWQHDDDRYAYGRTA